MPESTAQLCAAALTSPHERRLSEAQRRRALLQARSRRQTIHQPSAHVPSPQATIRGLWECIVASAKPANSGLQSWPVFPVGGAAHRAALLPGQRPGGGADRACAGEPVAALAASLRRASSRCSRRCSASLPGPCPPARSRVVRELTRDWSSRTRRRFLRRRRRRRQEKGGEGERAAHGAPDDGVQSIKKERRPEVTDAQRALGAATFVQL